ncbi:DoxX family protein [Allosalinactinospora lopnorensis]|uniref:DoxX family protein n=1 Tax=Allosalinactinospora lopnorensis TaxID=1352348 RepID=UPI000623FECF|nr:DoxX family protein [Allosalinactinospora lopnorensis]
MLIAAVVLPILLALAVLAIGVPKALKLESAVRQTEDMELDLRVMRLTGVFETLGGIGLLAGLAGGWLGITGAVWLAIAAGTGLFVLMLLALGFHMRRRDPVKAMAPSTVLLVLSTAVLVVLMRAA